MTLALLPALRRAAAVAFLTGVFSLVGHGQTSGLSIAASEQGLTELRYNGVNYLAYGDFRLNAVKFADAGTVTLPKMPFTAAWDAARRELTRTYAWGTVKVAYTVSGSRLTLAITTTNRGSDTIQGLFYEPLAVRFPVKPNEYDGNTPVLGHGTGQPTVLPMTHGNTTLVLTNDDPSRPLLVGFPWALDRPASMLVYPLRVNTDREGMYPNSLPLIQRPLAQGATDTYRISLRFVPTGTPLRDTAADVYRAFSAAQPFRLNWPDRRPIGSLILATAATGWRTNPRGWLLDRNIDITTEAGRAAFRQRVLAWADNSVRILKEMNAQGMITWDIEGEQFPHATTYVGDPRQFAAAAPEMADVADDYFARFRAAGLRVGVCLRPQEFVLAADGRSARQVEPNDPGQVLIDKIAFAKSRWGATLFYIDSNGDPGLPTDISVFARVAAAHPDVLLIPEHENTAYFTLSAPYNELRGGTASTPQPVRDVYPNAFSIVNTADGPIDARFADLQAAVNRGDIMMFRAWFDDPANAKVKRLLPTEADAAPPSVTLTAPADGASVSGTIDVTASATDDRGVAGVQFLLDNRPLGPEDTVAPYQTAWDTRTTSPGLHTLTVMARDAAGNRDTATVRVIVRHEAPDNERPTISLTSPAANTTVTGNITLSASASDNQGIASVQFLVDGTPHAGALTAAPYVVPLDTRTLRNGPQVVTAVARDAAGNTAAASASVTVANTTEDNTPPVVTFTAPANGARLSGIVAVAVAATDDRGVAGVRVLVNGQPLGADLTTPPYTLALDTRVLADGPYTLTAAARDAAGNTASAAVTVTVRNTVVPAVDSAAPSVALTAPSTQGHVRGTVSIEADATDDIAVTGVTFLVDNVVVGSATEAPYALPLDTTVLPNGNHLFQVVARDAAGNSRASHATISIQNTTGPACGTVGVKVFVGCYFANESLEGDGLPRLDSWVNFDWGASRPIAGLPDDGFSVRWLGAFHFDGGPYRIEMHIDDGVRLYVDDALVLDAWDQRGYRFHTVRHTIPAGTHTVRVEYRDSTNGATAKVAWTRQ